MDIADIIDTNEFDDWVNNYVKNIQHTSKDEEAPSQDRSDSKEHFMEIQKMTDVQEQENYRAKEAEEEWELEQLIDSVLTMDCLE